MAAVDAIKKLHTSMIDTIQAYEKAAEETDDAKLGWFFAEMIDLRKAEHRSLHRVLTEMGEQPDESGSFMATVHRTVIGARSAVTGITESSMKSFASGEENIVEEYDDALAQTDLHTETAELLRNQRSKLVAKIAKMKELSVGN